MVRRKTPQPSSKVISHTRPRFPVENAAPWKAWKSPTPGLSHSFPCAWKIPQTMRDFPHFPQGTATGLYIPSSNQTRKPTIQNPSKFDRFVTFLRESGIFLDAPTGISVNHDFVDLCRSERRRLTPARSTTRVCRSCRRATQSRLLPVQKSIA